MVVITTINKLIMCSHVKNFTRLHDNNAIAYFDQAQSMCNNKAYFSFGTGRKCVVETAFVLRIDSRRRLIKDKHIGVSVNSSGDSKLLPLSAGQLRTAELSAKHGVQCKLLFSFQRKARSFQRTQH